VRFTNLVTFRDHLAWAAPAYPHEIPTPVIGTAMTGKMAITNDELEEVAASVGILLSHRAIEPAMRARICPAQGYQCRYERFWMLTTTARLRR
jgi:hypothetical protein